MFFKIASYVVFALGAAMGSLAANASPTVVSGLTVSPGGVVGGPAEAARAGLLLQMSSVYDESFENSTTGRGLTSLNLNFLKAGGGTPITASMSGDSFGVESSAFNGRFNTTAGGRKFVEADVSNFTVTTFSEAISAFGFYAPDVGETSFLDVTLRETGGNVHSFRVDSGNLGGDGKLVFWGFFDSSGVSYNQITMRTSAASPVDTFGFDDFVTGRAIQAPTNGTPEPATLALLGIALLAASGARRLRR